MGNKSRVFSLTILISIIVIIVGATALKVYTNHIETARTIVEKKIEENACDCFRSKICEGDVVQLGFLIQNGYLERPIHPITKEDLPDELLIVMEEDSCKVDIG